MKDIKERLIPAVRRPQLIVVLQGLFSIFQILIMQVIFSISFHLKTLSLSLSLSIMLVPFSFCFPINYFSGKAQSDYPHGATEEAGTCILFKAKLYQPPYPRISLSNHTELITAHKKFYSMSNMPTSKSVLKFDASSLIISWAFIHHKIQTT